MKFYIETHGRVSAAKKTMWRTSELFTETANSLFLTPRISINYWADFYQIHIFYALHISRHTVVCQWPRKLCGTQVCYLQKPLILHF